MLLSPGVLALLAIDLRQGDTAGRMAVVAVAALLKSGRANLLRYRAVGLLLWLGWVHFLLIDTVHKTELYRSIPALEFHVVSDEIL